MPDTNMPNIIGRVRGERESAGLSDVVTEIENEGEADIRRQAREKLLKEKAIEIVGRGANIVTDAVYTDGDQRYVKAVTRNDAILETPRSNRAQAKIEKYLESTEDQRAAAFQQIGALVAEEASAIALRPFDKYVAPVVPVVQAIPAPAPPPRQKVVVVKKGLFGKETREEYEV